MAKSPRTFTSHSPPRARTLSGPATRRRSTREVLQTRNRAFGPNGVPTTSRQTSATRTDTTSRLPISLGSTNKRYEPSTHLRPAAIILERNDTSFLCTDETRRSTMKILTKHYIDGAFVESHGREAMDIINPTSGKVIGRVTRGDEEDTRH